MYSLCRIFKDIDSFQTLYLHHSRNNNDYAISLYNQYNFQNNFYYFLSLKFSKNFFENQNIRNGSLDYHNSLKIETSGFGINNNWVLIQFGRGKEVWGAGSDIELALSNNSNNYDYFMLSSDYGNLRVKYFHGFLEKESISQKKRYINGRGLEWSNKKNLIFSISEVIIYSGKNRGLEFGYLNPMNSHLEVEMNNRLTVGGYGGANAIWQASLDYLFDKKIRVSVNYLYDEYVIDQIEKAFNKEHGSAYSYKISYNLYIIKKYFSTLYFSNIFVGTPTFRHGNGTNNFVQSGKPIGWKFGSDGQQSTFGISVFNRKNIVFTTEIVKRQSGEENILLRPYEPYKDYLAGNFPSGLINTSWCINSTIDFLIRNNFNISINSRYNLKNTSPESVGFELIYYIK